MTAPRELRGHVPVYELTADGKCVVWCECGWPGGDDPDVWGRRLEPERAVLAFNAHLDAVGPDPGPLRLAMVTILTFMCVVLAGAVAAWLRWRR